MGRCYQCFREYADNIEVCPYCGQVRNTKAVQPIHLLPGTVLAGRYIIGQSVGAGGFGIVYRAWDQKLEAVVAVKEFFVPRLMNRAEGEKIVTVGKKPSAIEEYRFRKERFLAEARTMAQYSSCATIPNVFEFFEENNTAYIVMEFLNGMTLKEYLNKNGGRIPQDLALFITNEVAEALKALHKNKIIHRDVAPDNIFICSNKDVRIKLMDLGAAKLQDATDKMIDIVLKPGYAPVEQYDDTCSIGPWTDQYALGATLYVMLTGVKPDESTNRKISDEVVPPHVLNPQIPENLSNSVMKAMALEKHMRFKSLPDFQDAIGGRRKVVTLKQERKRKKGRLIGAIAAACLVIAVSTGLVLHTYQAKKAEAMLEPATISLWYSLEEGSTEQKAMESMEADFEAAFPDVDVQLTGIPAEQYTEKLLQAAKQEQLPAIFESTAAPLQVLNQCRDIDGILHSEQAASCLFLDQYHKYYWNQKQLPLAIWVPAAYVVTGGPVSVPYEQGYFEDISDFGPDVRVSAERESPARTYFPQTEFCDPEEFFNNEENTSPVLLGTTLDINRVRSTLTNYEKTCVYYRAERIPCGFTYEWSCAARDKAEIAAAERLLSWMLGNVYQTTLMITECSDGQIPINEACFHTKLQTRMLAPIEELWEQFTFEREGENRE